MNIPENDISLTIVMPCLNEEETLKICIEKAFSSFNRLGIRGEVVIADNGSTDNSVKIAESLGARVVHQPLKGYGNALKKGITEAHGKYILMGDADDSYDFSAIDGFISKLDEGYDLVMGSRLKGEIKKGAMTLSHRLGNPVMTGILNLLYHTGISDAHCGMRAFTKEAFKKMDLKCGGMEFASEMVVKAAKEKLRISEIPITLYPDGRSGPPHLRTIHDGWRHLRFLLIYCPAFLYILPGAIMLLFGGLILLVGLSDSFKLLDYTLGFHFNFLGSVLAIIGFQLCALGICARSFAYIHGFDKHDTVIEKILRHFSLEWNLLIGVCLALLGFVILATILFKWASSGFGPLFEVKNGILGVTLMAVGFQYISSSFFLSMILFEEEN